MMLLARRGLTEHTIGRDDARKELRRLAAAAPRRQQPTVVLLTGEAGIGKTRLVRDLLEELGGDSRALVGQARAGDQDGSFPLLRELVDGHLDAERPIPDSLQRWRHPLGHLLDPLVVMTDHPDDDHVHTGEELARAGVLLLRHLLATPRPVAVFEDLHWADPGSLEVFARLARSEAPLLLIGTFRPEEYDRRHPLADVLADLERGLPVEHLVVEALTRGEVAAFVQEVCGQAAPPATIERLYRRTRGNPFFLEEILSAGLPPPGSDADTRAAIGMLDTAPLPWSTSEAVMRRLARFGPDTCRLVQTAAVLGDWFTTDLLALVADRDEPAEVERTLAQLVRAGVLEERAVSTFGFRHALTRDGAASELLASERRAIHDRALEVLSEHGSAPPAVLARHAEQAGRHDQAATFARAAAFAAAHSGSPREALGLAELSLQRDPGRIELLELAAEMAAQVGEFAQANRHATAWAAAAEAAGDRAAVARAHAQRAWSAWLQGDSAQAAQAMQTAVDVAASLEPGPARAEALIAQARLLMAEKQPARAVERAEEAIAISDAAGDVVSRCRAELVKASSMLDSPDHQAETHQRAAAALLDQVRRRSEEVGAVDTLAGAFHNRLVPEQPDDLPLTEAWQILEQAKAVAARHGIERLTNKLGLLEVHLAVLDGRQAHAEEMLPVAQRALLGDAEANWLACIDAHLGLETDDLERAEAAHRRQRSLLRPPFRAEAELDTQATGIALAAAAGDPAGALAALEGCGRILSAVCACVGAGWWLAAMDAVDAGVDPDAVLALRDRDRPPAFPRHRGLVEHALGVVAAAAGDDTAAVEHLTRAVTAERRQRPAPRLADAHHRLAELLGRTGHRDRARQHVQDGIGLLTRWPGRRRDALEALDRRLGAGGSGRGHDLLTNRELEVVQLLARGYTNSQIAERLFISRKTASTHVSNILTKTGFERRTQIATWAVDQGLARPG